MLPIIVGTEMKSCDPLVLHEDKHVASLKQTEKMRLRFLPLYKNKANR